MSAIAIEHMTPSDLDEVVRISASGFSPPWTRAMFQDELARAVSSCRVARDEDGAVLGYAISWIVATEQQLLAIATDPAHRRRGVARALMDDLIALGDAAGATECFLEVRPSNVAANALYRRYAFELHDARRAYYDDGEDAWILVRRR